MRYPKFIVRLGDSLAKLIADIKAGLRFYDKHKENKITIDHEPPKNPEYRDIWIDTSHEYIPPTQYFTVFMIGEAEEAEIVVPRLFLSLTSLISPAFQPSSASIYTA